MYCWRGERIRKLVRSVEKLKSSEVKKQVDSRTKEFKNLGKKKDDDIFNELCFCILTANYSAEKGIKIQKEIGNGFCCLNEKQLARKLKQLGHRYPNTRAAYIITARKHKSGLKRKIKSFSNDKELRDWIVKNIKGLGCKEASHFLRNIGHEDFAIIDFHIIDVLANHGLIEQPKTLTRKKYLEVEEVLKKLAKKSGLNLAELDLYLWYIETGKVLK